MINVLINILSLTFIAQVFRLFTPYYLGASAANFSERAGVINISIEGFMISSAFSYSFFAISTGNSIVALFLALIVNLLFSLFFSLFVIKLKVNHIVTGVGFNLLMAGLSKFLLVFIFNSSSNSPQFKSLPNIILLEDIPLIGDVISDYIIIFAIALIFISRYLLFKTKFGLRLRSAGENPEAGESLGIQVRKYKLYAVLICGFLSGLGGIWLADNQNSFSDGMIAGRGYIALAAMIIGKWKPVNIFFACMMFAFFEALEISLQISGTSIPSQIIQIVPYAITILVLIFFVAKTKPPAADGVPY
jgi:general nucleoside transport system permease protein